MGVQDCEQADLYVAISESVRRRDHALVARTSFDARDPTVVRCEHAKRNLRIPVRETRSQTFAQSALFEAMCRQKCTCLSGCEFYTFMRGSVNRSRAEAPVSVLTDWILSRSKLIPKVLPLSFCIRFNPYTQITLLFKHESVKK